MRVPTAILVSAAALVSLLAAGRAAACGLDDGSLAGLLRSAPALAAPDEGPAAPADASLRWCDVRSAPFWELVEIRECTLPHVAHALHEAGPAALDIVAATLWDPVPEARAVAAWALRELATPPASERWTSPADPTLVSALARAMEDDVPTVRRLAASAAWRLGPDAAPLAPALRRLLSDPDPTTRAEAARALGDAGVVDAATAADLVAALGDPAPDVARAAAVSLTAWGPTIEPALEARVEAGRDGVREAAGHALRTLLLAGP